MKKINIHDRLLELNEDLHQDEIWLRILEEAYEEADVETLEELIEKIDNANEYIIRSIIADGEDLLELKKEIMDEYFEEEMDDDYYEGFED